MTLTEQWKKGELPFGCYYIKDINDETFADHYTNNGFRNGFEDFFDDEISEVLAPVPSYDHFVELTEKVKENQQLKELLDYCRELLEMDGYENVVEEINNAIGEK